MRKIGVYKAIALNDDMKYVINGRFLSQRLTGVQRFEREITRALDRIVEPGRFILAVPKNYDRSFKLANIDIVEIGFLKGILWEQVSLCFFQIKHKCI